MGSARLHDDTACVRVVVVVVVLSLERLEGAEIENMKACMVLGCPWCDAARID